MADVQTSEINAKFAPLNTGPNILYSDRSSEDEHFFNKTIFTKNGMYEHGGRLNFKINILFYGDNS
jgi:hypothetical protein